MFNPPGPIDDDIVLIAISPPQASLPLHPPIADFHRSSEDWYNTFKHTRNTHPMTDVAELDQYKQQLASLLLQVTPDENLLSGILNFVRGRMVSLILKDINGSIKRFEQPPMAQHQSKDDAAEVLVDRMWTDFYHPVFRYYQAQHHSLKMEESRSRKRTVEIRKVNDRFLKIAKLSRDFFFDLIKQLLTRHKLDFQVPLTIYEFLDMEVEPNATPIRKSDQQTIIKMIYVVHCSMLHIGGTSRYRSTLSQFLSKDKHENFNKALEMCRHAEMLIPAIGEARNQMGLIHSAQGETLNAAYEFMRSSLARMPSKFGALNYNKIMARNESLVDSVNKTKLEDNCTMKNIRKYISLYFLALVGYHTQSSWKREDGVLCNGMKVDMLEKELLKYVKQLASEKGDDKFFFERLLLILIGSVPGVSKGSVSELTALLRFTFKYIVALESVFVEQWPENRPRSLMLLPTLRIVVSWLKAQKMALAYSHKAVEFLQTSAQVANLIYTNDSESYDQRPKREQYFNEDVGVKEFVPLGRMLWDFDDDATIFEDPMKVIGRWAEHDLEEENSARLVSVGTMFKSLLCGREGVHFDAAKKELVVDLSKIVKLKLRAVESTAASTKKAGKKNKRRDNGSKDNKDKEKKNSKENNDKKRPPKKAKKPVVIDSDSESDESDVELISEEVYNRHNEKLSEKYKPLQRTAESFSKPTQLILEENSQMTQMVDSIVDDVRIESDSSSGFQSPQPRSSPQFQSSNSQSLNSPTPPFPAQQAFNSPTPQLFQAPQVFQSPGYPSPQAQQFQNVYGGIWANPYGMYQQHGQPQVPASYPQLYPYYGGTPNQ